MWQIIKFKHKKEKKIQKGSLTNILAVIWFWNCKTTIKYYEYYCFFLFLSPFLRVDRREKSTCDEIVAATCAHAQVLSSTLTVKTANGCARRDYHWKNDEDDDDSSLVASFAGAVFCERRGVTVVWTYAKDAADNTDGARESSRVPRRRSVQINTTYIYIWMCGYRVYISSSVAQYITSCTLMVPTYLYIYINCDVLSSRRRPPARQIWWWSTGAAGSCRRKLYYVLLFFVCNNIL